MKFLTANFRTDRGEIDLVMRDKDCLVFVEVKTRSSEKYAKAESAITYSKKLRMVKAARLFAKEYKLENYPLRFDVVIVMPDEKGKAVIRHYENAFVP